LVVPLWSTNIPEPSKHLIKNICGVKDMVLPKYEMHLQLPDVLGSLGG
jgi:hypothetical protein